MARVEFTAHLRGLFPRLDEAPLVVEADTIASLIQELESQNPGIAFYLCDELGRLRRHVNVFVNGELIIDRPKLTDQLDAESTVFIAQALTGG